MTVRNVEKFITSLPGGKRKQVHTQVIDIDYVKNKDRGLRFDTPTTGIFISNTPIVIDADEKFIGMYHRQLEFKYGDEMTYLLLVLENTKPYQEAPCDSVAQVINLNTTRMRDNKLAVPEFAELIQRSNDPYQPDHILGYVTSQHLVECLETDVTNEGVFASLIYAGFDIWLGNQGDLDFGYIVLKLMSYCGCGSIEYTVPPMLEELIHNYTVEDSRFDYKKTDLLRAKYGNVGVDMGFAIFDELDLIEHGSSVPGWLSSFGQFMKATFERGWEVSDVVLPVKPAEPRVENLPDTMSHFETEQISPSVPEFASNLKKVMASLPSVADLSFSPGSTSEFANLKITPPGDKVVFGPDLKSLMSVSDTPLPQNVARVTLPTSGIEIHIASGLSEDNRQYTIVRSKPRIGRGQINPTYYYADRIDDLQRNPAFDFSKRDRRFLSHDVDPIAFLYDDITFSVWLDELGFGLSATVKWLDQTYLTAIRSEANSPVIGYVATMSELTHDLLQDTGYGDYSIEVHTDLDLLGMSVSNCLIEHNSVGYSVTKFFTKELPENSSFNPEQLMVLKRTVGLVNMYAFVHGTVFATVAQAQASYKDI